MPKEQRIQIRVREETKETIENFAREHDTTVAEVIRISIEEFINNKEGVRLITKNKIYSQRMLPGVGLPLVITGDIEWLRKQLKMLHNMNGSQIEAAVNYINDGNVYSDRAEYKIATDEDIQTEKEQNKIFEKVRGCPGEEAVKAIEEIQERFRAK